ncbi:hypothetical protein DPEC_G00173700 [Dallia pectoralis]|uniref:Uncharacterized protein n=1 Tax=Dallia pectoralis TaxID=75939 RepID=A0ACC2GEC0_DALPE|nr:hypothetical protein DPEC_G00173700 [Dallia pectoralis]
MENTRVRNRAIMLKRKTRIRPVNDARTYILSLRDKPEFMERFIDSNKETKTSLIEHSSHDDSNNDAVVTQEAKHRTSVLETKTSLIEHSSHDDSNNDAVVTQAPKQQASVLERKTSLTEHSSHDDSNNDAVVTQAPKQQASVLERKTSLTEHSSHDDSNNDAVVTQKKDACSRGLHPIDGSVSLSVTSALDVPTRWHGETEREESCTRTPPTLTAVQHHRVPGPTPQIKSSPSSGFIGLFASSCFCDGLPVNAVVVVEGRDGLAGGWGRREKKREEEVAVVE